MKKMFLSVFVASVALANNARAANYQFTWYANEDICDGSAVTYIRECFQENVGNLSQFGRDYLDDFVLTHDSVCNNGPEHLSEFMNYGTMEYNFPSLLDTHPDYETLFNCMWEGSQRDPVEAIDYIVL